MCTIGCYELPFLRLPEFPPGAAALDLRTGGTAPSPGRSMIVDLASAVDQPRRFETRLAILLREDLATWQKLNVTAFHGERDRGCG